MNYYLNFQMDLLHKGWFTEFSPDDLEEIKKINNKEKNLNEECSNMMKMNGQDICGPWTGQAFSLAVDEILFSDKSKYQDVLVFKRYIYYFLNNKKKKIKNNQKKLLKINFK